MTITEVRGRVEAMGVCFDKHDPARLKRNDRITLQ